MGLKECKLFFTEKVEDRLQNEMERISEHYFVKIIFLKGVITLLYQHPI
jgi:hypothetical protein